MTRDKNIKLTVNDKEVYYFFTLDAAQQVADILEKYENAKTKIEEV